MPVPVKDQPLHEQDRVERSIRNFAAIKKPTAVDIQRVAAIAQVETQLDVYRLAGKYKELDDLEEEEHQSKQLALHMALENDPRPHEECHAHATVSGVHKGAATQRAIIAWHRIRIDDPHNGCWLPRNTASLVKMPEHLRKAVPHSRIHRFNYYFWLDREINMNKIKSQKQLIKALDEIENRLQSGTQPGYVMNRKGVGLPL
ncbi:AHH domain-containing protein [Sansalvadorimonas sp. 2012CJ34-2]|uniref:AHH domain-containing protein n=1 Tax=Parendozoicomonas callyspongiae TaxID=2942213 RepID=A0ABT0PL94_9GAMM|nr:AHH domain-containing protein [Sansalvadorimonas sp. 2012CJ34-2]MCL6272144.1 AHH domain-containing protein [Sansalvadorimonas sp. 2012CJ34-2]